MKKSKILSVFLVACLLVSLLPAAAFAVSANSTLSGTIYLPGQNTAPSGGVNVTLCISTDNLTPSNKNDDVLVKQVLKIEEGQKSISYSIMVPKSGNSNAKYSVSYTVGNGYAPFGYYSENGTTAIKSELTPVNLNAGDTGNVNITILPGKTISGKILLGNQTTAPSNDMKYTITAVQEGNNSSTRDDDIIITKDVTVPKNKKEMAYSLTVPLNTVGKGYKLYYRYTDGSYSEAGYYNTNRTSYSAGTYTLIDVANNPVINLTTLPFTNISGRVYLPEGVTAPANGIQVTVIALNRGTLSAASDDFYIEKSVTIPKDANYVNYSLTVPVKNVGYAVSYSVASAAGYVTEGYYSESGTKTDYNEASLVETGNAAVTGINLVIQKTSTVTPTPTPIPAPLEKYDLNGDGIVDMLDMAELARIIIDQYDKDGYNIPYGLSKKYEYNEGELKRIRGVFKLFDNNRNGLKMFNSVNQWFRFFNGEDDDDDGKNNNGNKYGNSKNKGK